MALMDKPKELSVGAVKMTIREGCTHRDQYDLRVPGRLSLDIAEALRAMGSVSGQDALFIVEVDQKHQLTVAPKQGRVFIMPRLSVPKEKQLAHALEVAEFISERLQQTASENAKNGTPEKTAAKNQE